MRSLVKGGGVGGGLTLPPPGSPADGSMPTQLTPNGLAANLPVTSHSFIRHYQV